MLNRAGQSLPFQSADSAEAVGSETVLQFRPLSLRTEAVGDTFRIQAAILAAFRDALNRRRFTEIVTSKIVSGGTEGGSNLFEIKYFDRAAYLAQRPQFYKEHGVAGLERVYEAGHVYRAEPHASSRHLTEYYSLCRVRIHRWSGGCDSARAGAACGHVRESQREIWRGNPEISTGSAALDVRRALLGVRCLS